MPEITNLDLSICFLLLLEEIKYILININGWLQLLQEHFVFTQEKKNNWSHNSELNLGISLSMLLW